jgi:hypothetical protein
MGEASTRRRAHDALLQAHPWCIYCGAPADSVEHMPPIIMFRGRQRPKGLEFPSCLACNNGTSHSDLVASLLDEPRTLRQGKRGRSGISSGMHGSSQRREESESFMQPSAIHSPLLYSPLTTARSFRMRHPINSRSSVLAISSARTRFLTQGEVRRCAGVRMNDTKAGGRRPVIRAFEK